MKVANPNYKATQVYPHCLSPVAAPPPCQVEAQAHNTPPTRTKQAKYAAKRRRQQFNRKLHKAQEREALANKRVQRLENALYAAAKSLAKCEHQPTSTAEDDYVLDLEMEQLPMPPSWNKPKAAAVVTTKSPAELELKRKVLEGKVPTAVADAGASSSVGKYLESECGQYQMADPLITTGRKSDKTFQYGGGSCARAKEIKELPYDVRGEAKDVHMVPGTQNTLLSTNKFALEDYIKVFDKDEVNVYDANDVEIKTTRGAILRGWRVPSEGLWRFPLVKDAQRICNLNTETGILKHELQLYLSEKAPPPLEGINNVYELKTKPELIRYYHAAAGFPTKPS